jgi:hypothetical protein
MATLRARRRTRTSRAARPATMIIRSIKTKPDLYITGYRRRQDLSIQIAALANRFFRYLKAANVFVEDLLKPVAQLFRPAALAYDKHFVANRAFRGSGQSYLKASDQFRFFKHEFMLPQICRANIICKGNPGIITNHVGADVLICPEERSSSCLRCSKTCRALLDKGGRGRPPLRGSWWSPDI